MYSDEEDRNKNGVSPIKYPDSYIYGVSDKKKNRFFWRKDINVTLESPIDKETGALLQSMTLQEWLAPTLREYFFILLMMIMLIAGIFIWLGPQGTIPVVVYGSNFTITAQNLSQSHRPLRYNSNIIQFTGRGPTPPGSNEVLNFKAVGIGYTNLTIMESGDVGYGTGVLVLP